MIDSQNTARRTTALAAVLGCTAVAIAGCGGGQASSGTPGQQSLLPAATAAQPAPAAPKPAPAVPQQHSYVVTPLATIESRALKRLHEYQAAQQHQKEMTAAEHARAVLEGVRDLTDAVLVSSGLEFATFDVLDGGATVTINVQPSDACQLRGSDPYNVESRILDNSDIVDHVHLRLTTGGSVIKYLKAHCVAHRSAVGLGTMLRSATGTGFGEPKAFVVHRSGWTIDWSSQSSLLEISVYKGGHLQSVPVHQQGRGHGRVTLKGKGTYTVRVAATAGWSLTVRDGTPPKPPTVTPKSPPSSKP